MTIPEHPSHTAPASPLVSIIVPTKNSSQFLEACLVSICAQTYKNIELIVVDNSSTDDTQAIATRYTDKVYTHGPERSAQVNYGVTVATGEYVYKVDSDFVLDPLVVEQCVTEIQKGFDAIVVHNSPDVRVSWIAKIRKFEVDMYKYDITHSSARFVKKTVYEAVHGFNEKITAGEDYDFQNKLNRNGYKTGFIAAEALHLGEPTHFWPHMKKYYHYGRDFVNFKNENKAESKKQLRIVRTVYVKHAGTFLVHPIRTVLFCLYTISKFMFGGLGYVSGVLFPRQLHQDPPGAQRIPNFIHTNINHSQMTDQPLVSVIIACKNTAEYFERCLQSIKNQTYKNIEIVIVDNFSTDATFAIGQRYADKAFQIGPERSTQFNYGFKQSKGDLIYRIGPDYVLEPDVVEKCIDKITEGYDALALHNRSVGDSIWAKVRYLERESYRNDKSIVAVRFFKRKVFADLGMFDETLVAGEDFDIHNRMVAAGYKWTHVDAVENHIGEPKNIFEVWNKFYYYGRTIKRYQKKNKGIAKQQLVIFRPSFKKIQAELRKSPKLFLAFYFYTFVKYSAGFVGMLRGAPSALPGQIQSA